MPRAQFKIEPVSTSRLRKTGIFQILARDFRQKFQILGRYRVRQRLGETEKARDVRAFSRVFGTNLTRAELVAGAAGFELLNGRMLSLKPRPSKCDLNFCGDLPKADISTTTICERVYWIGGESPAHNHVNAGLAD